MHNHGSFIFGRVFKATISSKSIFYRRACGCQEKLSPQRRGNETISGKNENKLEKGDESLKELLDIILTMGVKNFIIIGLKQEGG